MTTRDAVNVIHNTCQTIYVLSIAFDNTIEHYHFTTPLLRNIFEASIANDYKGQNLFVQRNEYKLNPIAMDELERHNPRE